MEKLKPSRTQPPVVSRSRTVNYNYWFTPTSEEEAADLTRKDRPIRCGVRRRVLDATNFHTVATTLVVIFSLSSQALAASLNTDFSVQCPILSAQADSFASQCLQRARPVYKYFDYQIEYHSALIGSPNANSHFALGCTLNAHHQIAFLGVYFAINSDYFREASSVPVAAVDFDGNIAVNLNNRLVNFIAVRPFETESFPLLNKDVVAKNCDDPELPPNEVKDLQGQVYHLIIRRSYNSISVHSCVTEDDVCRPDGEYLQLFGDYDNHIIYAPPAQYFLLYFIENDGSILARKDELQKVCPSYYNERASGNPLSEGAVDMIQEICLSISPSLISAP